jgi:hypothetical protein
VHAYKGLSFNHCAYKGHDRWIIFLSQLALPKKIINVNDEYLTLDIKVRYENLTMQIRCSC